MMTDTSKVLPRIKEPAAGLKRRVAAAASAAENAKTATPANPAMRKIRFNDTKYSLKSTAVRKMPPFTIKAKKGVTRLERLFLQSSKWPLQRTLPPARIPFFRSSSQRAEQILTLPRALRAVLEIHRRIRRPMQDSLHRTESEVSSSSRQKGNLTHSRSRISA